jgi:rare lipoprotein A
MRLHAWVTLGVLMALIACSTPKPPPPSAPTPAITPVSLPRAPAFRQEGRASWYGEKHDGKVTANGETFDMDEMTAAHRTLAFGTVLKVTNLSNGKSVKVVINDRGPYVGGRIIDLSRAAAHAIGIDEEKGIGRVRLERVDGADPEQVRSAGR